MTSTDANHVRERLGFRDGDKGTHSSRTLMLRELERLLDAAPADARMPEYRQLVVEDNVLGKPTAVTREHTVRKLKALYGLDPDLPVFRALRRLWDVDEESHPLLAMLATYARDPLVRMTSAVVLDTDVGGSVSRDGIEEALTHSLGSRFTERTLRSTASNLLSSFTQSGHLAGGSQKVRHHASPTPVSATYAFFLAYCEGYRAQRILLSPWARLLDVPEEDLIDLARAASRRGLMDFKQMGNVVDLRFPDLLTPEEEELTREQG